MIELTLLFPSKNTYAKQTVTRKRAIINVWASIKYKAKKKECFEVDYLAGLKNLSKSVQSVTSEPVPKSRYYIVFL